MDVSTSARGRTTQRTRPRKRTATSALGKTSTWRPCGWRRSRGGGRHGGSTCGIRRRGVRLPNLVARQSFGRDPRALDEEGRTAIATDEGKGKDDRCFGQDCLEKRSLAAYARTIFEKPGGVGQVILCERSLSVLVPPIPASQ